MGQVNTGEVIDGKYRIVRVLGEGGMGTVYDGYHELIHRRVAIKVLHPEVSRDDLAASRFEREAQAAGRIGSAHIVEVLDLGSLPSGARYMVMELLEGESLKQRLARHRLPSLRAVLDWSQQLLQGIGAAHDKGIVHRDLKPDNVFLQQRDGRDFVKLLDFGISKFTHQNLPGGLAVTSTGAVMGTPLYMSPEQARGARDVDHRTDIYAVGVILYECLTGRVPFEAASFNELMFKIALEAPTGIRTINPGAEPGLVSIVDKAMARDPGDRFSSAGELQSALEAWSRSGVVLSSRQHPMASTRPLTELAEGRMGASQNAGYGTVAESRTNGSWSHSKWSPGEGRRASGWRLAGAGVVIGLALSAVAAAAYVLWLKPDWSDTPATTQLANLPQPPTAGAPAQPQGSMGTVSPVNHEAVQIRPRVRPLVAEPERPRQNDELRAEPDRATAGDEPSPIAQDLEPARPTSKKKERPAPRRWARRQKATPTRKPQASPTTTKSPPSPRRENPAAGAPIRVRDRIIRTEL